MMNAEIARKTISEFVFVQQNTARQIGLDKVASVLVENLLVMGQLHDELAESCEDLAKKLVRLFEKDRHDSTLLAVMLLGNLIVVAQGKPEIRHLCEPVARHIMKLYWKTPFFERPLLGSPSGALASSSIASETPPQKTVTPLEGNKRDPQ